MRAIRSRRRRPAAVAMVSRFVADHGGVEYATDAMKRNATMAADIFMDFPPSEARDALVDLTAYVVARRD
jgi:geranylgeranyl pyrophosphate synthase